MATGQNQIYPNSNTYQGISLLQAAFNDLMEDGLQGDINLNGHRVINSADPVNSQDLATKAYVLTQTAGSLPSGASLSDISIANPSVASITASSQKIINLSLGTGSTDAANVQNITNAIAAAGTGYYPNTTTLNNIVPPDDNVDMNGFKLISLGLGTISTDSITFGQVTSQIAALSSVYLPLSATIQSIFNSNGGTLNFSSTAVSSSYTAVSNNDLVNFLTLNTILANYLLSSTTIQQLFTSNGGTLNFASTNIQTTFTAVNNSDVVNYLTLTNRLANYLLNTSTIQSIFNTTGGTLNFGSTDVQSSYTAISNNDLVNFITLTNKLALYRLQTDSLSIISTSSPALTDIDANNQVITNLADPVLNSDAANASYVKDRLDNKNFINYTTGAIENSRIQCNSANILINPNILSGISDISLSNNPATVTGFQIAYGTDLLLQPAGITSGSSPISFINVAGQIIKGGRSPISGTDYAIKSYVDSSILPTNQSLAQISIANPNAAVVDQNNFEIINCPGISYDSNITPSDILLSSTDIEFNKLALFNESITLAPNKYTYQNSLTDPTMAASGYAYITENYASTLFEPIGGGGGSVQSAIQFPAVIPTDTLAISSHQLYLTLNSNAAGLVTSQSGSSIILDSVLGNLVFQSSGGVIQSNGKITYTGTAPTISANQDLTNKLYVDTVAATKLASTSTLQTIYTANNSGLNVGSNIIQSSNVASSANHMVNQLYYQTQMRGIGDLGYGGSIVPNSRVFFPSTLSTQISTVNGGLQSWTDSGSGGLTTQYSIGVGSGYLTSLQDLFTFGASRTWQLGARILSCATTAVQGASFTFSHLTGYTFDQSGNISVASTPWSFVTPLWVNNIYAKISDLATTNANVTTNTNNITALQNYNPTPPGGLMPYCGATAPAGWFLCDGSTVVNMSSLYPLLYAAIGNTNVLPVLNDGRYVKGSGGAGEVLRGSYFGQNQSHTHGVGSYVNANSTTVASTTGNNAPNTQISCPSGFSNGTVNGVGSVNSIQSTSANFSSTTNHTHSVPSLTVNAPVISGTSAAQGGTKVEVDRFIITWIIKHD